MSQNCKTLRKDLVRTHGIASLLQHPAAAIGEKHGQVHHHDHQVLVPAIGLLAPEAGMPD
jgi:hypothetical protein